MNPISSIAVVAALLAPAQPETFEYEIVEGDTCAGIARKVYGSPKHHPVIHEYNRWLGPRLPHHLEAGKTLTLPKTLPPELPDAEVTAARRTVEARSPQTSDWSNAIPGLDLYNGWRVNTHDRASAEITFRDQSRIELRENTLVIIYGGTRDKARRQTSEATLDRGSLRSRLGAYTGKGDSAVTITTPSAVAEFEGGAALVTVDNEGTSRVANHGEGAAAVRTPGKKTKATKIKSRMGSKVKPGKAPSKPKPLPPTPAWIEGGPTMFVSPGDQGGTIVGRWGPVAEAVSYRVDVSRQPDGSEVMLSKVGRSDKLDYAAQRLPAGDYYVSVAAIDADAFESPPSEAQKLTVTTVQLVTPGAAPLPEVPPEGQAAEIPRVLRGTRLDTPKGLECKVGEGEAVAEPVLDTVGQHEVSCITADGRVAPGFAVIVVDVEVAANAEAQSAVRTQTTTAEFSMNADVPLPKRLWVEAPEGFLVGSPQPGQTPGAWMVRVHADDSAPGEASLRVMADAAGEAVELGQLPLTVEDPGAAPEVARGGPASKGPERHMFELGVLGGVMFPSANHDLFQETGAPLYQFERLRVASPEFGIRVGYYPIRWVGAELENSFVASRTRDTDNSATLFALRGHVVVQAPWRITPLLTLGGGALGISGPLPDGYDSTDTDASRGLGRDFDSAFHVGLGMKVFLTRWAVLRLDVRDVLTRTGPQEFTNSSARVAHSPEVLLGFSAAFGRHGTKAPPSKRKRGSKPKPAETGAGKAKAGASGSTTGG